jgi:hypothetical protein
MGKAYGVATGLVKRSLFWFGLWCAVPAIALLGVTVAPPLSLMRSATASYVPDQIWQTVLVEHSTSKAEVVTTTRSVTRIVIEASGSAVKSEWSGVCLPAANTITRPGAGTTTTKPGTTSAVFPIQVLSVPAAKTGELLVTCSVATYAVMMGRGHLTIKIQVLVPEIGSL